MKGLWQMAAIAAIVTSVGCVSLRHERQPIPASASLVPPDMPRVGRTARLDDMDERKREFFERMIRETSMTPPAPRAKQAAGALLWIPQGPAPMLNGQIENVTPQDQVQGAIHTVVAHPTDADILYIGAVNGGVWKTNDASSSTPTWTPLTDTLPTLSIGALDLDPTDPTHETLLAGLGRFSSFGRAGGFLSGLLQTTDGGVTWTEIGDPLLVGQNFSCVAARGSVLVAGSNSFFGGGGLFRSDDAGASWQQIELEGGVTPFVADMIGDPTDPDTLYLTAGGGSSESGIYRSDDVGATWNLISLDAELDAAFDTNITTAELAMASNGRLYVNVLDSGRPIYIGYSDDPTSAAPSWTRMDLPLLIDRTPRTLDDASNTSPIVISTPDGDVVDAQNATPIVIVTSQPHGLVGVESVAVVDVVGNEAANGIFRVDVIDATSFALVDSEGSGNYESGGTWQALHNLFNGDIVLVEEVTGNGAANGLFFVQTMGSSEFALVDSEGNGAYSGGGVWVEADGANPRGKPGGQGFLHTSIAVDPLDPQTIYVGGDRQTTPFPNSIGAENFSGRLFRGDASQPRASQVPSPQWDHLTNSDSVADAPEGGTASGSSPHADSRELTFDAAGNLIETSDGGIFRRSNPSNNGGDWSSLAGSLSVTEFHDIAYDTVGNVLIGGTQDNNNSVQTTPGGMAWDNEGFSGDGGDIETARLEAGLSVRYGSAQFLFGFQRRVYDEDNQLLSLDFPALLLPSGESLFDVDFGRSFVQDYELNVIDPTRGIIGTATLYETFDGFDNIIDVSGQQSTSIAGLAYGGFKDGIANPDLIVFEAGDVLRRTAGGGARVFDTVGDYPGSRARDLVLDPDDWANVFLIDTSDRVWRTDETEVWEEITGNLSIGELRAVEYVAALEFDRLIVAGRDGVHAMRLDQPGVWTELGAGLPRAPVFDLDYDAEDNLLAAGTLGRGAWLLALETCASDNDGDIVCDTVDNCLGLANPGQSDADADGAGDGCDCAPDDASAFAMPSLVARLELTKPAFASLDADLSWTVPAEPGGPVPQYEVLVSSDAEQLALAGVVESCLPVVGETATDDTQLTSVRFYLVRAVNSCGDGPLGVTSLGAERAPGAVCP